MAIRHFNEKPHPGLGRVRAALPGTLELGVCAMIFATAVGIPVACWLRLNAVPFSITQRLAWRDRLFNAYLLVGHDADHAGFGHWNLTPVSGRVSDMVFLDDSIR